MVKDFLGVDLELTDGDLVINPQGDLNLTYYEYNLAQALAKRLLTDDVIETTDEDGKIILKSRIIDGQVYGSSLYQIVGKMPQPYLSGLIGDMIVESLERDPRVDSILDINVTKLRDTIKVNVIVQAVSSTNPLNLVIELGT